MYFTIGDSFADHWVDVVLTALLAVVGWFSADRLRGMDARHERAEKKIEELGERIAALEGRTSPNGRIYAE